LVKPGQNKFITLAKFYLARRDIDIWDNKIYESYQKSLKYNDLSSISELRSISENGKGLLILGFHYGPNCIGYTLHKSGIKLSILALPENIPLLDEMPYKRLIPQEYIFRGSYDGMLPINHSEKRFLQLMLEGRCGILLNDTLVNPNSKYAKLLDHNFPVGVFPFKLAIKHSFPVVVIWYSKIRGKGYKLNVRRIEFNTIESGIAQYIEILEQIIRENPYLWFFGREFQEYISSH
jgi:lauroyl/myristoyl acyltransferase